jgi:broad specificity phosphatase PhoE
VTTTIYLVRHGRTALNAQGRFRGRENSPLDGPGLREAAEVARALVDVGLRTVYSSPLLRCVQTAEFIARAASVPVVPEPDLVDADLGRWEGVTPDEAEKRDPETYALFQRRPQLARAPEGEAIADVEDREFEALRRIARRHEGAAVAAVTHEIPIRLVIARLKRIEGSGFWDFDLPTGSITQLRYWGGALSLATDASAKVTR